MLTERELPNKRRMLPKAIKLVYFVKIPIVTFTAIHVIIVLHR